MRTSATALAGALALTFASFACAEVTHNPATAGINVSADGIKKTAQLVNWKVNLDSPNKVGTVSRGLFCSGSENFVYTANYNKYFAGRVGVMFKEKASTLGYPKYGGSDSAFADASTNSADYRLGILLLDMNQDICMIGLEVSGNARLTMKAELYSNKLQKVVYSRKVEGTFSSDSKINVEKFVDGLVGNALDQMFADPNYVSNFRDDTASPVEKPAEPIMVKNGSKPSDKIAKDSKAIRSAVVTIDNGGSTGSGFYIGRDGYIITNYHVVGDARYVKVRLPEGYAVPGEVVRKNAARDVALIKTDVQPPTPVFVRTTAAKVGEEVYAVGSPFGTQLNNTVTRGILSGERIVNDQKYIQSDVAINPGSSGGPLVDAEGGLIAVAVLQRVNAAGIGLFIPIDEALGKLGLSVQ